ncbi:MAG: penicillin-binding transpeptidase domain-containing protein [Fusobacteriaceae bacterium]
MLLLKVFAMIINFILGIGSFFIGYPSIGIYLLFLLAYQFYIYMSLKNLRKLSYFNRRSKILAMIFHLILLTIIARAVNVQLINGNFFEGMLREQITADTIKKGQRGIIFDSNNKKLAFNYYVYNLVVDPTQISGNSLAINFLKKICYEKLIEVDLDNIFKNIDNASLKENRYKVISKKISEENKNKIQEISKFFGMTHKEIFFERIIERKYFRANIYQNLVGNIGFQPNKSGYQKVGVFGIEKIYERYLNGKILKVQGSFTKKREIALPTSDDRIDSSLDGKNVYLTIDDDIEYILNAEIEKQFIGKKAEEAYGLVMNPNTGEIFGTAYFSKNNKELRNPIFQNQLEPGSVFKPMIVGAALEENFIRTDSKFDIGNGELTLHGYTINEASRTTKGILTVREILEKSSNIGMVKIGDNFSDEKFDEWLMKYGFYEKTGVDFTSELKPYSVSYKKWDRLKKANMPFGQGIAVTPIQIATAFSSVINGGILFKPYIVAKIENQNGTVIRRNTPIVRGKTVSPETSKLMRKMLKDVVMLGGGKRAKVLGHDIGGKTGTAQISSPKVGYLQNEYLSSFLGFFPVDKPQYVVLVMFYKPQEKNQEAMYGGAVSAPVFASIASQIVERKSLESQNIKVLSKILVEKDVAKQNFVNQLQGRATMINLKGMSSRQVLGIFKNTRFNIEIIGNGTTVISQEPEVGKNLDNIDNIKIDLGEAKVK